MADTPDETALSVAGQTALAKPKTAVEKLERAYDKLQRRDLAVSDAANRFADLPTRWEDPLDSHVMLLLTMSDADIIAAGWRSRRELRMAAYGRLPKKEWPASMQAAHERVGMRIRKQEEKAQRNVFNLNVVNIPAARRPDERNVVVVDVTSEKK